MIFKKKDTTADQKIREELNDIRRGLDKLIEDGLDYDRRMQEAAW